MPQPKKIETDGETILVSDNVKNLDVESLVEPYKEKEEQIEEEEEREELFPVAKLICEFASSYSSPPSSVHETFEGKVINYLLHNGTETLTFVLPIEKAIYLCDFHKYTPGIQRVMIELKYIYHDEPKSLKNWKEKSGVFSLSGIELTSFEKSKCIVTVKLNRVS